jgi:signal transduction histidine kinase
MLVVVFLFSVVGINEAPYLFLFVILFSSLLMRISFLILCTFFIAVLIYWLKPFGSDGLLIAVIALALYQSVWVLTVNGALEEAWAHSVMAASLAQEAQLRRGEVLRLNQALGSANSQLAQSNTKLDVARREAESARSMKEQFALQVSHELRTPLSIILGFLEVMQRYPEVYGPMKWPPALRQDLAEVQSNARHLADLVDDILDLARIETRRMPVRREHSDLGDVIQEACALARRLLRGKMVQLDVVLPTGLPPLFIDRTRVRQVLLNLLANASRFTLQGEIVVSVQQEGQEVIVSVSDSGVGIPEEQLASLFTPFQRSVSPSETSPAGKGLGLAIAKRFVEMHGGRIWATSQVGRGSVFSFSLPVVHQYPPFLTSTGELPDVAPAESPTLVVAGDAESSAYLRRRLECCKVLDAADLSEAVELASASRHGTVLLNVAPDSPEASHIAPAPILPTGVRLIQCCLPVGPWLVDRELYDAWLVKPVRSERLLAMVHHYLPMGKLLVVDDDASFVQLVRRIMEAESCHHVVSAAHDLASATSLLATESFGLVILDISLPDGDGRRLARHLRDSASGKDIPVMVVSAWLPEPMSGSAGRSCGLSVTTAEGFEEEQLLGLIRATTHQSRRSQDAQSA